MEIISPKYQSSIKELAKAGGYEHPEDSLPALKEAASAYFFPEDVIEAFLDHRYPDTSQIGESIKKIARASIFQDSGVEAYASHNAPIILGLTEIAAHAAKDDPKVCYVLCSADVSNLAGLNRDAKDRVLADEILSHLSRIPEDCTRAWATDHRYNLNIMPIRTGGDEFRYVIKLKSKEDIDLKALDSQLGVLAENIHAEAENFSKKTGISCIEHDKFERAPGVGITVAFKPIDGETPAIERMLNVMNGEITQARLLRDENYQPPQQISNTIRRPPMLATVRTIPALNPYADMKHWQPGVTESLQAFAMRSALKLAGFDALASAEDVVVYDRHKRQTILNPASDSVASLSSDQLVAVEAVLSAENMRGLVDPVTRCYSAAYHNDVANYYGLEEKRNKVLRLDATNLSGLNRISEAFGDAMLREMAKILEHGYEENLVNGGHKPAILREGGGQFAVILPSTAPSKVIKDFKDAVEKGIKVLGAQTISDFAKAHRFPPIGQSEPVMLISDIPAPRAGTKSGIHITYEQGNPNERKTQPTRLA